MFEENGFKLYFWTKNNELEVSEPKALAIEIRQEIRKFYRSRACVTSPKVRAWRSAFCSFRWSRRDCNHMGQLQVSEQLKKGRTSLQKFDDLSQDLQTGSYGVSDKCTNILGYSRLRNM
ncbi:hypothetical protein TNCV_98731 [Trichonephila clavipes]|nr:hypothetical protein TNCV_98731 [Trichonephila clavipes]